MRCDPLSEELGLTCSDPYRSECSVSEMGCIFFQGKCRAHGCGPHSRNIREGLLVLFANISPSRGMGRSVVFKWCALSKNHLAIFNSAHLRFLNTCTVQLFDM